MTSFKHISHGAELTKKFLSERQKGLQKSLLTSVPKLNKILMNGIDWNRIFTIAGLSGCLEGSTKIVINRGKRPSGRTYTIAELYHKYHNEWDKKIPTNIRVYKEDEDSISYNRMEDVVFSGVKPVYEVITTSGHKIRSTLDHKFLTGKGVKDEDLFVPLGELAVGDYVLVRNKTIKKPKVRHYRKSITGQFKYYSNARTKLVEGKYTYFECLEQRAIYDAQLNGFSDIREFLKLCCSPNTFIFSDPAMEIHHKNGDTSDNRLDNLELLSKSEHAREHLRLHNNIYTTQLELITEIRYIGEVETYDICCKAPYNNFIANNFVVHNSGKSMILENFKRDFIALNKDQDFCILSFEFEMLIEDQLSRNISSKMKTSVKELYSAQEPLEEEKLEEAFKLLDDYATAPIYYIDNVMTVGEIINSIKVFSMEQVEIEPNRGLVVTLDHVLLTKGKTTDSEKVIVDELMHALVALKKYFAAKGVKVIFLILSQLNRDIESTERVTNPALHYPTKNDIFAASSVYYCSDYVMITHKPNDLRGIGEFYGPPQTDNPKGMPLKTPEGREMVYWHVIKERFGEKKVISMVEDFKNSQICQF